MNICISTVVDENYQCYVPLFVWCVHHVYPSYEVKIFSREKDFPDFPKLRYNTIALRFVVPPQHYENYDYVYVTDIDMFLMPERTSIDQFHLGEMVGTGLCYSNSLRNVHHYAGFQSLSGLHFASREWLLRTESVRANYYDLLKKGLVGLYREYDGVMLYRMAEKSGLGLPQKYKLKKRHHGIHLGNFRLFDKKEAWSDRIPMEWRYQWKQWMSEPEFAELVRVCKNENAEADILITKMEKFIEETTV